MKRFFRIVAVLILALSCAGCGDDIDTESMKLTSPAFRDGQRIPDKFAFVGDNINPALNWTGAPPETGSFALTLIDRDAFTREPFVHWVIYNLPADCTGLPEGLPREERLDEPEGAMHGANSVPRDNLGYRGPVAPAGYGAHRYQFILYAIDEALELEPGLTKAELLKKIRGHILAEAQLNGTYETSDEYDEGTDVIVK